MLLRPDEVLIARVDGREYQASGVVCCHCGRSHVVEAALQSLVTGRADAMGFCHRCHAPHCAECSTCQTQEQQAANVEAGRHRLDSGGRVAFYLPTAFPK